MNTLISIVMAIVLNFLGLEVQERKLVASTQLEVKEQTNLVECDKISAKNTIEVIHQSESNINVN